MKTVKIALAALTIAAFAFDGCKKGPDDPFMSLHTRKGRVVGDWKVSAGSGSSTSGTNTDTWTYDGATLTTVSGSTTTTQAETETISYMKDGTYKIVVTQTGTGYTDTYTEQGTWNFTGKVGDAKNKDRIISRATSASDVVVAGSTTTSNTDTYTGDGSDGGPESTMYLDELKNKEMMTTYDGSTTSGSTTTSSKGSWTLIPQ
ncbi:MAG: hypothetical protein HY064_01940 [Bacteroidetes bacterium]|nr:hypothetical protein [Bacteroidota bacterium]